MLVEEASAQGGISIVYSRASVHKQLEANNVTPKIFGNTNISNNFKILCQTLFGLFLIYWNSLKVFFYYIMDIEFEIIVLTNLQWMLNQGLRSKFKSQGEGG